MSFFRSAAVRGLCPPGCFDFLVMADRKSKNSRNLVQSARFKRDGGRSSRKCPSYIRCSQRKMSQFFSGFRRKPAHTKTQQGTDKASEHNGRKVFLPVSTGGVNFVFYPLSSIHFTSSLFAPTSFFASASATNRVFCPPGMGGYKKE